MKLSMLALLIGLGSSPAIPSLAADAPKAPEPQGAPAAQSAPAQPRAAARPARRHVARNADARKCLELQDNMAVARCAQPYL